MRPMLPRRMETGLRWRYESPHGEPPREALPGACDLLAPPPPPVMQRADLSAGARLLFSTLRAREDYVVCIDPRAVAVRLGVSERKLTSCLGELTRAGVIAGWLGNLVFLA